MESEPLQVQGRKKMNRDGKQKEKVLFQQNLFPAGKYEEWKKVIQSLEKISEIRLRANKPVFVFYNGKENVLDKNGEIQRQAEEARTITREEIDELVNYWCQSSRYAYESQLKQGFLTLKNGHRVGICGEAVLDEVNLLKKIKYISSLNIRIAHEVKGVGEKILPYLYEGKRVKNLLIISPPGAGKTTMLRDIVRIISDGSCKEEGQNISLIDERKEIAACYQGIPQLDVGIRTDVMDGCTKKAGMKMVLRSMAPKVIAVDELGEREEVLLLKEILRSGCSIMASVHGDSYETVRRKEEFKAIFLEDYFDLILELKKENNEFHGTVYEKGKIEPCFVY